jgi:LAO/AO transport system kinase
MSSPLRRQGSPAARVVDELLAAARSGDDGALARLLTLASQGGDYGAVVDRSTLIRSQKAYVIGVTGPPGAGKSTLISALIRVLRTTGATVAVLAVDPSSPLNGGSMLGDRVRMATAEDVGVFIRSVPARGSLGGLADVVERSLRVFDAVGTEWIILETVGVGQSEIDVCHHADTTILLTVPGAGDQIQAMKSGLVELADLLVINKADQGGAGDAYAFLHRALALRPKTSWTPPVLQTTATTGEGIEDLKTWINRHREHLESTGELEPRRKMQRRAELEVEVGRRLKCLMSELLEVPSASRVVNAVENRSMAARDGAKRLVDVLCAAQSAGSQLETSEATLDRADS